VDTRYIDLSVVVVLVVFSPPRYDVLRMIPTAVGAGFGLAQYYGYACERLANLVKGACSSFGIMMDEQGNLVEQEKL
jgi:hypothetical protein